MKLRLNPGIKARLAHLSAYLAPPPTANSNPRSTGAGCPSTPNPANAAQALEAGASSGSIRRECFELADLAS